MITTVILLVLWTWGLTPLWVNILCTVLLALRFIIKSINSIIKALDKKAERDAEKSFNEIMKKFKN